MKQLLTTLILGGVLAMPAFAALQEGDEAPDFNLQASMDGQAFDFSLAEARENGPVVVYFYPSAYTRGCNIQAKSFADNMDRFRAAGASVVGVSLDSIERLNDFSADPEYCASEFPVASDPDGAIARTFDLEVAGAREGARDTRGEMIDHGFAERTTFIVTPDGRIAATVGGVSPEENVNQALAVIEDMSM